jgi:hypothetical protein
MSSCCIPVSYVLGPLLSLVFVWPYAYYFILSTLSFTLSNT